MISIPNTYAWGTSRRFNSWASWCKKHYGSRIQKVTVHAGFTCPNRDGSLGTGGCTFCNNRGFNPSYCHDEEPIRVQIDRGIRFLNQRYRNPDTYVAYFQAYSNTYDSLVNLSRKYEEALAHPQIKGLVIGTRPDCIDDQKLQYFKELSKDHLVFLEYGVESCYEETLVRVNRGHTFAQSAEAICRTADYGLHCGIHMIFGFPGESREQMLAQNAILSKLPINSIKFHQLQIVKDTAMAREYLEHPEHFRFFGMEEYVEFVVQFLEGLRPDISIERFAGEVPPDYNLGQGWGKVRSDQVLLMIEKRLGNLNTWQGRHWCPEG